MPSYKLMYFDGRGLAEPARMLFHLKGQKFEDDRFTLEEWRSRKADKKLFPTAHAPVLVVDDTVIPQSNAIFRYLASEYGYMGESKLETAQIDAVIETMGDIQQKMGPFFGQRDPAKKAELLKDFKETTSKPYFLHLEDLIKSAGGKNFVGNKLSLADIVVFNMADNMINGRFIKIEDILDPYPELQSFFQAFIDESPLSSYLKSRPVSA